MVERRDPIAEQIHIQEVWSLGVFFRLSSHDPLREAHRFVSPILAQLRENCDNVSYPCDLQALSRHIHVAIVSA